MMADHSSPTPAHVEDTVQAVARLHEVHHEQANWVERAAGRMTAAIASPMFIVTMLGAMITWVVLNLIAPTIGISSPDPPPFEWLQGFATLLALFATMLILTSQRHDDQLASRRDQLVLQLAMVSDRKMGKLIELVEELRRDHPDLRDRLDQEADAMARPSDHRAVLDALGEQAGRSSGNR